MTILVVDDHEQNRYLLQVLLGANGYQVATAIDGAEALAMARKTPPDLIVSDILMPVMDGFSLCREWKRDERLKAIPFVFYTATYTDDRDRELAFSLGAQRFIVKPAEPGCFIQAIREAIEEAQHPPSESAPQPIGGPEVEETGHLQQYNEALVRKLEAKMEQLEQAKHALEDDVAARRLAEEAIQRQSVFLLRLIDAMPYPVFYKDRRGRYLGCNRAFERFYGTAKAEIAGKTVYDIAPKELADVYFKADEDLFAHPGTQTYEGVVQSSDGVLHDVTFHKATFEGPDGQVEGLIGAVVDITDRKRAEAAIKDQLAELHRWHEATLGREGRVLELKSEVNALLAKAGQPPRYPSAVEGGATPCPDRS